MENLEWLDDAFSKGYVDDLEATCCLSGYDKCGGEVKLSNMMVISNDIIITSPLEVKNLYAIVKTWPKRQSYAPFLWYIEQSIIHDVVGVKYDFLFPRCKKNQYRINAIREAYPELSKKLNFIDNNKKKNDILKEKIWQYANEEASKLHQESKKQKISQHTISKLVRQRLEKEKIFYDADYIRSFLKGWKFVPR